MNVNEHCLHELLQLNGTEFVIPVYQRNYAWNTEQCEQLLSDILFITSTEKKHFLGTITYIVHSDKRIEFVIIDGQQRLTTIMLLLKALQQNPSTKKNKELQKRIGDYSFDSNNKEKMRLKPIKKDREAFEYVMNGQHTQFSGKSNVVNNFKFFLRETSKFIDVQIEKMLASFTRLQIARVILDKNAGDDPQMVFERINATGLHLKGLDLIRNFLMMELKPDEQERIFNDYWAKIEEKFSDEKDSEKIIQKFISVYLRIYKGANVKDDEIEIYKSFKDLRKDTFDDDSEKILKDMIKFARIYKIIIDKNALWQYDNENPKEKRILREKINLIDDLQFGTAYPFVMRLIDDFENGELNFENLSEILNLLISYL